MFAALKGFIPKKFLSPVDSSSSGSAHSGPVAAAPPPSRPLASSPTIPERSSPGGAPAAAVPPGGNLMDLTSPEEPVKEKTLLPLDLDFSLPVRNEDYRLFTHIFWGHRKNFLRHMLCFFNVFVVIVFLSGNKRHESYYMV